MAVVTQEIQDQVSSLYIAFFGRAPDALGFGHWAQDLANGASVYEVAANFALSPEFESTYGGLTPAQAVNRFYQNVLNRDADAEGLEYWVGEIEEGTPFSEVAYQIVWAAFVGGPTVDPMDNALVNNKVDVSEYFALVMQSNDTMLAKTAFNWVTSESASVLKAISELNQIAPSGTQTLTTGEDFLIGTAGDDTFNAPIRDNGNTLQSGDVIFGGPGVNTLNATVGNSQNFAILAETQDVQNVVIRTQADARDSTQNNLYTTPVTIDAELMQDVQRWEFSNGRADLIIEDVRIGGSSDQDSPFFRPTSDVTIAMTKTDPGNVDYAVYFDPESLRAGAQTVTASVQVALEPLINESDFVPATPLLDNPYDIMNVIIDGEAVQIFINSTGDIGGAPIQTTYDDLEAAINRGLDAAGYGDVTVTQIPNGVTFSAKDGTIRTASTFVLERDGSIIEVPAANAWVASAGLPPNNAFGAVMEPFGGDADNPLITSTIELDNVGRDSMGGDLLIGSLSTGLTSNSMGVERFEITVMGDRASKLQTLDSTNNTLQEIQVLNEEGGNADLWVLGRVGYSGLDLSILGSFNQTQNVLPGSAVQNTYLDRTFDDRWAQFAGRPTPEEFRAAGGLGLVDNAIGLLQGIIPGLDVFLQGGERTYDNPETRVNVGLSTGFGIKDVRLFDAAAYNGDVRLTATLSDEVRAKYLDNQDTQPGPEDDDVNFEYLLGNGNDQLFLHVSAENFEQTGAVTRADFALDIIGGAGDDIIETLLGDGSGASTEITVGTEVEFETENWLWNQMAVDSLLIDGGEGNDTIRTWGAGAFTILGGAGNDTIYTDNTGYQGDPTTPGLDNPGTFNNGRATWVLNVWDNTDPADIQINDLDSGANPSLGLYKADLIVSFKGITRVMEIDQYASSSLDINQMIKDLVNNDNELSKLIVAEDGPANSLVVRSYIDGVMDVADLAVSIDSSGAAPVLTAADISMYNSANGTNFTTAAQVWTDVQANNTTWTTDGQYNSAFGQQAGVDLIGADSTAFQGYFSDADNTVGNMVEGEAGDDVIVLSTQFMSQEMVVFSGEFGNDTIVNFTADGASVPVLGADLIDVTSYLGGSVASLTQGGYDLNDRGVSIIAEDTSATGNDTLAKVLAKFTGEAVTDDFVVFVYDTDNVATVYEVNGGGAGNPATGSAVGTVDLADTDFSSLVLSNFV